MAVSVTAEGVRPSGDGVSGGQRLGPTRASRPRFRRRRSRLHDALAGTALLLAVGLVAHLLIVVTERALHLFR